MTTARSLTVPGDEWETVRRKVVPHATKDTSRPILEHVQLLVRDGQRRWHATDSYTAVRFRGGETQAAEGQVLLHRSMFSPARPKPSKVHVGWNRTSVTVSAAEWDEPRTCSVEEGNYPDIDKLHWSRDSSEVTCLITTEPPTSDLKFGALPLVLGDSRVRVAGTWQTIGRSYGVASPVLVALNDRLTRRCFRTVLVDGEAHLRVPVDTTRPAVWANGVVDVLQMPVRIDGSAWFGEVDA